MADIKDKLITVESLKAAYEALLQRITLDNMGITASPDEINILCGVKVSTDDINHLEGTNSNIQEQIDDIANGCNIRTFTKPEQFGCTAASSPSEIRAALPNGSILQCLPDELTHEGWRFPKGFDLLQMYKGNTLDPKGNSARVRTVLYGKRFADGDMQSETDDMGNPTGVWFNLCRIAKQSIVLKADKWTNMTQTVAVDNISENVVVIPSAASTFEDVYDASNIRCITKVDGSLTFACDFMPVSDVTVNILIMC